MTTTVGDLLDRLHAQAWTLASPTADATPHQDRASAVRAAWFPIARHTTRLLQNLPFAADSTHRDHARVIIDTLEPLHAHRPPSTSGAYRPLLAMGVQVGAIADLIAPAGVRAVDDAGASGLQTSVLAALYCAARWSVPRLTAETKNRPNRITATLRKLVVLTEPFAAIPPGQRVTTLEDLAAVRPHEPGLDAALLGWSRTVEDQLVHRYTMTSVGFQTIAADLAILTAGAIVALQATAPDALAVPELHRPAIAALREAHQAWTGLTTWPEGLFLGGRAAPDLRSASTNLRSEVRALLRNDDGWASPDELWQRTTPADLLAMTRRTVTTAAEIATAYANTLIDHTIGRERPWIKAQALPPTHRGPTENQAAAHDRWVPTPQALVDAVHVRLANHAQHARDKAQSAEVVVLATQTSPDPAIERRVSVEAGRLVLPGAGRWEEVLPMTRRVAPLAPRGVVAPVSGRWGGAPTPSA